MQSAVPETKKELLDLIDAALSGQDVVIQPEGRAAIRLVPIEKRQFRHGILADKLKGPIPDFLEPMSEEDLRLWEGRN